MFKKINYLYIPGLKPTGFFKIRIPRGGHVGFSGSAVSYKSADPARTASLAASADFLAV